MQANSTQAPAKPRFATPIVAIWAVLGALAVAYLGLLVVRPGVLAQYLPASPEPSTPESNEGQRATAANAMAEVDALKVTVGQMQEDVTQLKGDVAAQFEKTSAWETRIATLETKTDAVIAAAPPATSKAAAAALKAAAAKAAALAKPVIAPATPDAAALQPALPPATAADAAALPALQAPSSPMPGVQEITAPKPPAKTSEMKVINAPPPAAQAAAQPPAPATGIETGSVAQSAVAAAPVVTFGNGTVSSTPKTSAVVIATGPSIDSIRLSWSLLSERNAENLGGLQPRYKAGVDANGLVYELLAGPVASAADAKKICKELASKAIQCRVAEFVGEQL